MATFTERIQFVVEAVTGTAEKNLKGLRNEVAKAEGVTGKAKAGIANLGQSIRANLVPALAGGAAAVGAFAVNAVQQFADAAREAGRLADTTGLATDEASRFLAVLKPLNVEGADLADILGNINTKAAEGRLDELGIQAEDSNERLIETIEYLGSITDETKRAQLAAELLGEEGTRQLAPLIASAGDLRDRLADVSDAQVIDDEERKKAAEFDETMRKLEGSFRDISLTLGETLIPAFENLATVVSAIPDLPDWLDRLLFEGALNTGVDVLNDIYRLLPGGPNVSPGDIARERFGGDTSGVGTGMGPRATVNVTVNNPPGTDGRQVATDIQNYYRANGQANTSGLP